MKEDKEVDKDIKSSIYLAKEFIITYIVQKQMQEEDIIDYNALAGFATYDLDLNDIMAAAEELDKEGILEKVNSDEKSAVRLTEKGYKIVNKA